MDEVSYHYFLYRYFTLHPSALHAGRGVEHTGELFRHVAAARLLHIPERPGNYHHRRYDADGGIASLPGGGKHYVREYGYYRERQQHQRERADKRLRQSFGR